jgi:hypothetical protein
MTLAGCRVLGALTDFDGPRGCFPSYDAIADQSGVPRRSVARAITHLCELGWLSYQRGGGRRSTGDRATANRYVLAYDRAAAAGRTTTGGSTGGTGGRDDDGQERVPSTALIPERGSEERVPSAALNNAGAVKKECHSVQERVPHRAGKSATGGTLTNPEPIQEPTSPPPVDRPAHAHAREAGDTGDAERGEGAAGQHDRQDEARGAAATAERSDSRGRGAEALSGPVQRQLRVFSQVDGGQREREPQPARQLAAATAETAQAAAAPDQAEPAATSVQVLDLAAAHLHCGRKLWRDAIEGWCEALGADAVLAIVRRVIHDGGSRDDFREAVTAAKRRQDRARRHGQPAAATGTAAAPGSSASADSGAARAGRDVSDRCRFCDQRAVGTTVTTPHCREHANEARRQPMLGRRQQGEPPTPTQDAQRQQKRADQAQREPNRDTDQQDPEHRPAAAAAAG